ncbi:c-type cytochrome [Tamlana sp. 62-3]|uniref:C-type cytochrome n=1 Tax=Neotamlana sargassicola TaxID=2883125 RepID=A0A9X1L7X9_9FLAO|nr:c-type cytochrome [Tamlana sargassicola]MCB4808233.1 c-type cytochrome [Tamlana sargassicola]
MPANITYLLKIVDHFFNQFLNKHVLISFFLVAIISSCKTETKNTPEISLIDYKIESGFNIQVVASEPFLDAPVALDFDDAGRMWTVEMNGYMQNLEGTGDDEPNGVISILEDTNNDGIVDKKKVFIDSLVLPRAIAHVYNGLLYAEPPNLWFVEIENDKPKNKVLVDSLYADGGNVEHQPNGLLMNIDNWIYNAKSHFRYQRKDGVWLKEPTAFRGQWGITKDNFGRLFYNTNNMQLLGDYVLPNTAIENRYFKPKAVLGQSLTPNQKVYPLHPTLVNRGYVKGVLNSDSLLVNVTSACGPLIYRGNQFPDSYFENAFICVPEANLIKRNIVNFSNVKLSANQAIENVEFLAATDPSFRPVNINNGPDGNLYVVDMHRGVIQDKAFMTPYLHKALSESGLDTILKKGRILKVTHNNSTKNYKPIKFSSLNIFELVELLKHDNGWVRDKAQQKLILRSSEEAIAPLLRLINSETVNEITKIHALHTLNGMSRLTFNDLLKLLNSEDHFKVKCHAIVLAKQFATKENTITFYKTLNKLIEVNNPELDLYILSSLNNWATFNNSEFFNLIDALSKRYVDNDIYQEAALNSLATFETDYLKRLEKSNTNEDSSITRNLQNTINNKSLNKQNSIYVNNNVVTDSRTSGYRIFKQLCATCHGIDGEGVESLAPPLIHSEYVSGSSKKLALVLLHGLTGPIHVNKKRFDLNITMPGLGNNSDFTNKDILDVIRYIKNAFSESNTKLTEKDIENLRKVLPSSGSVFTEEELLKLKL